MKIIPSILLALFLLCQNAFAQNLSPDQSRVIDSLTAHWNQAGRPGGAISILYKGKAFTQKTRGLADISQNKEIRPQTAFHIAQLSNSFIAFALLQLHHQKHLSLEDKVVDYVSELKHAHQELSIKHLLQQSSGIHDFEILKNISGWSDEQAFSIDDALSLLSKQASPAFKPGSEFSYSRSNILLASVIIERASKLPFAKYMHTHLFKPLGMNNSFVLSPENQSSPIIAHSYRPDENEQSMTLIPSHKETYASVSIVSSIEDMTKWEMNLMRPSSATKEIVDQFNNYVRLDNGAYFSVPQGKMTYGQKYIHKERGIET
ncbi:MAG: serine hydrolase domain-containing protein, partial [Bacteroidota bacterium]